MEVEELLLITVHLFFNQVTDFNKRLRYFRTTFFTILLLILSFIFILQADLASNRFLQQVPLTTLCQSDIPAVYLGGYDVLTNIIASHESLPIITRPPEASAQLKYDASCSAIQTGTFYGVYASNGNFSAPAVSYNLSACVSSGGLCPQYEEPSFCPCLSTSSTQTCSTSACSPLYRDDSSRTCSTYVSHVSTFTIDLIYCNPTLISFLQPAGFLGACFCLREFSQATISITSSISNLVSPVCQDFIVSYLQAKAIVYSVSFVTVVINMLIRELQVRLLTYPSLLSSPRER